MEKRKCFQCGKDKFLDEFYQKGKNKSGAIRYDSICRVCRKKQVQDLYRRKKGKHVSLSPQLKNETLNIPPRGLIEPIKVKKTIKTTPKRIIEPRKLETNAIVKSIDFTLQEEIIGRELSDMERYDSVSRLNEFISILRGEYSRMEGCHVYLK